MSIELSRLVQELGDSLCVRASADSGARVGRLASFAHLLESPVADPENGILALADSAWLRSTEPHELRAVLATAKKLGVTGVIAFGAHEVSSGGINVFRQLKLLFAAASGFGPEEPESSSEVRFRLQTILDREVQRDQNRLRIVQRLLTAVNDQDPIASLIVQLGRHCEGSALLYDSAGKVVESTGSAPANLVNNELTRRDLTTGAFTVGRWNVMGRDVSIRAQSYVLVLASRSMSLLDEYGPFMLDSVANLLGTFHSLDSFAMVQQVQHSAHLFKELELGIPLGKEKQYWEWLREYGFTPFAPLRFVSASTANRRLLTKSELESIAHFAARSATPVLVSEHARTSELPPGFHMLAQASPALEDWLLRHSGRMSVGVSAPYSQLSQTPEMGRSAQLAENMALKRLRSPRGHDSTVVYVDHLSPAEYLLARAYSHRDQAPLEDYVVKLREHPHLLRSVLVYFSERMKIAEAASTLGIHQNTLRYRLTKVETLLNVPLNDPATIANLYLALYEELDGLGHT